MAVKLSVHNENVISLLGGIVDVSVLSHRISRVEVDNVTIFVGLAAFDQCAVFFESVIFAFGVFNKIEFHCCVAEFLICQHAIGDEDLDIVPFLFKVSAVSFEYFFKA